VEEASKNLEGDLAIRPIFHQDKARVEAHIFIASSPIACTLRFSACTPWHPGSLLPFR
jgi:hypothetical protein